MVEDEVLEVAVVQQRVDVRLDDGQDDVPQSRIGRVAALFDKCKGVNEVGLVLAVRWCKGVLELTSCETLQGFDLVEVRDRVDSNRER